MSESKSKSEEVGRCCAEQERGSKHGGQEREEMESSNSECV
jgi:hypothetical protein